jgi:transcriptional regulator with XRE-family HTH domain
LRQRRAWRQADLGRRASLSRDPVSRAERGQLDGITVGSLDRLAEALGATLVVDVRWRGGELDRLIDRAHAAVQEATARRLTAAGWMVRAEVSFNHYGDRGSCDLIAWHPATATVLVVEVKVRIGNLQETLHRLDTKARLGHLLATQLGWPPPTAVVRALVLADARTNRRIVDRHGALFRSLSVRGRPALRWIHHPVPAPSGLLWFQAESDAGASRTRRTDRAGSGHDVG